MLQSFIGWTVMLIKWAVFLSVVFYAPIITPKVCEFSEYHFNLKVKWIGIVVYILLMLLTGVAVFWNIQDNPIRAWNSFTTD